ncbi:MAG: DUF4347 domain-containing protein [Thermodesulfobacteriota bacterium]
MNAWWKPRPKVMVRGLTLEQLEERIVLNATVDQAPADNSHQAANTATQQISSDHATSGQSSSTPDAVKDGSAASAGATQSSGASDAGKSASQTVTTTTGSSSPATQETKTGTSSAQTSQGTLDVVLVSDGLSKAKELSQAATETAKVTVYDAKKDTLSDLVSVLEQMVESSGNKIGHLAWLSHGESGSVTLSAMDVVTVASVESDATPWKTIGSLLAADARIDFYGCDIGSGEAGTCLVAALAKATGATVWASDDATGNVTGSDWVLEVRSGDSGKAALIDPTKLDGIPVVMDDLVGTEAGNNTLTHNRATPYDNIKGLGGNDTITVQNTRVVNNDVLGDGGTGANPNDNDTITINGAVSRNVEGGRGNDTITVRGRVDGYLSGGFGDDTVNVYTWAIGTSLPPGNADLEGDSGNDVLNLYFTNVTVSGTADSGSATYAGNTLVWQHFEHVNVYGTSGADTITINLGATVDSISSLQGGDTINVNGTVLGNVNAENPATGTAANTINISGSVGGNVIGGAGNETVTVSGTGSVSGNLSLGNGTNQVNVNNSGVINGTVTVGTGSDTINVANNGKIRGEVNLGNGTNTVNVNTATTGSGEIAKITGGTGADTITVSKGGKITGDVNLGSTTATTNNIVTLNDTASVGGKITSSARGTDTVTLNGTSSVVGAVSLGDGTNRVNVSGTTSKIGGDVNLGNGTNTVTVSTSVAGNGIAGNYLGGTGADTLTVSNNGRIAGDVTLGGGTTNNSVTLNNSGAVGGKITSTTAAGTDTVAINHTSSVGSWLSLGAGTNNVTVTGTLGKDAANGMSLFTGAGNDRLTVNAAGIVAGWVHLGNGTNNVTVSGAVQGLEDGSGRSIITGTGNDVFNAITTWNIAGIVDAGSGTETLTLTYPAIWVKSGSTPANGSATDSAGGAAKLRWQNFENIYVTGTTANDQITIENAAQVTRIDGGAGNDTITNNGTVTQYVLGNTGDDTITNSGTISQYVSAGTGNDRVTNSGVVTQYVRGDAGDDTITNSGTISRYILGDDGADSITNNGTVSQYIYGGNQNDTIENNGSVGSDVRGDAGDDTITNNGNITGNVQGGYGADTIVNSSGARVRGTGGIYGDTTASNASDGIDRITNAGTVDYYIYGGGRADTILNDTTGSARRIYGDYAAAVGTDGNDTITNDGTLTRPTATDGAIYGSGGADSITNNGTGVRLIQGDAGNDTIENSAGASADYLYGNDGNDTITNHGTVNFDISGGNNNDTINTDGTVNRNVLGDAGDDRVYYLGGTVVGSMQGGTHTPVGDALYLEAGTAVDAGSIPASGSGTLSPNPKVLWSQFEAMQILNAAPVLDDSGAPELADILEDVLPAANGGTTVSDLIASMAPGGITDANGDNLGIAVTGAAVSGSGTWEYSTNNGTSWNLLGTPSDSAAVVLAHDALLRYLPAANDNGTIDPAVTFRGWDETGGHANGSVVDTTGATGGRNPFSVDSDTASITVTLVNDAPAGTDNTITMLEDGTYALTAADFGFTDPHDAGHPAANNFAQVQITQLETAGRLQLNGADVTLNQIIDRTDVDAGLLTFAPTADENGAGYANFQFAVIDDGGTANGGVNIDQTPNTMTFDVTAVNDAPAGTDNTITMLEDGTYALTAADFGFTDPIDAGHPAPNNFAQVQIIQLETAGRLQLNGVDVTLNQIIDRADIGAGLLTFAPVADENGAGYANFQFAVIDDGGTANGGVNIDQTPNTMTFDVTAVNDAPAGTDNTISMLEDGTYALTAADFGFTDPIDAGHPAPNNFAQVQIIQLETAGRLQLNGVDVTLNQIIDRADVDAGLLTFAPVADENGAGYANFRFAVIDDGGTANGGVNTDQTPNTMTFDVTSVNDAPVAGDITVAGYEDTDVVVVGWDFSDPQDAIGAAGPDGPASITVTSLPANGTLYYDADSDGRGDAGEEIALGTPGATVSWADATINDRVLFRGDPDWFGTTSFQYTVTDDHPTNPLTSAPATVTLDIDDTPEPLADGGTGAPGSSSPAQGTLFLVVPTNESVVDFSLLYAGTKGTEGVGGGPSLSTTSSVALTGLSTTSLGAFVGIGEGGAVGNVVPNEAGTVPEQPFGPGQQGNESAGGQPAPVDGSGQSWQPSGLYAYQGLSLSQFLADWRKTPWDQEGVLVFNAEEIALALDMSTTEGVPAHRVADATVGGKALVFDMSEAKVADMLAAARIESMIDSDSVAEILPAYPARLFDLSEVRLSELFA